MFFAKNAKTYRFNLCVIPGTECNEVHITLRVLCAKLCALCVKILGNPTISEIVFQQIFANPADSEAIPYRPFLPIYNPCRDFSFSSLVTCHSSLVTLLYFEYLAISLTNNSFSNSTW